jgi:anti-sigma factor RsiW
MRDHFATLRGHRYIHVCLGLYALGALPRGEHATVSAHLARCEMCQREWAQLAEVATLLGELAPPDVRALVDEFGG